MLQEKRERNFQNIETNSNPNFFIMVKLKPPKTKIVQGNYESFKETMERDLFSNLPLFVQEPHLAKVWCGDASTL